MPRLRSSCLFVVCCIVGAAGIPRSQPPTFDLLILNGRMLDGSGNPWLRRDIGVRGDRIAEIGRLSGAHAPTIIDAADRLVTPGFIDVHSHAAGGLDDPALRQARPILAQGVTTIVVNPDGGGPVNLPEQAALLRAGGIGPNVALLIGHGSVRREVLGTVDRSPTPPELDRMRSLVREAMAAGAFGLSSGLFYVPGSFARTEELVELARAAGESGGLYTSHIRDEGNYSIGVVAAVQEVIRIAEEAGVIGVVSHMKALGPENWGLATAATLRIDEARARGVEVYADQYPYEASSTSLRAALVPGGVKPSEAIVRENLRRRGGPEAVLISLYRPERSLEGRSLQEIARQRSVSPELAAMQLMERGDASIVSFNMSELDIRQIMTRPYTMASSDGGLVAPTDGKPHPRNNGAFARRLAVYVRERQVVGLEFAIRSMTSLPASVFGLRDRGAIREGALADIAIFDGARIRDTATYADPHQVAEGMWSVIVNGVVVLNEGRFTDALPGRILSRHQSR
jgi:N-acyl-D-amino-acid deacylase